MSDLNRDILNADSIRFSQLVCANPLKQTLGAALTVDKRMPSVIALDANGSTRVITMPAAADVEGKVWLIKNLTAATYALTVNDDALSPNLIVSIAATKAAIICVVAGVWCVFGVLA